MVAVRSVLSRLEGEWDSLRLNLEKKKILKTHTLLRPN